MVDMTMESPLSRLSSLREEFKPEDYIQPHYKEAYRLAIDALVVNGREAYDELIKAERMGSFLSEEELLFIESNVEQPGKASEPEEGQEWDTRDKASSSGTYWPIHSDVETPDLDLGWPEVMHEKIQTNINLLFHPPRQNSPTIKEVIRRQIQEARQVIAIVMDVFTDVDIFKEIVEASVRGVAVYVLLDDYQFRSFLTMAEKQDVQIQRLRNMRVRTVKGQEYLCRSGAKFHGAMKQKFLLVDCRTVVYGSFSFMWSYEKINLCMVQVITGQLVESYDEEFRMLFARSAVPAALMPPDIAANRLPGQYLAHSVHHFERKDHLRHTLDSVYLRTCGSQARMQQQTEGFQHEMQERGPYNHRPLNNHLHHLQNRLHPLQMAETNNFLKRHSYAGERREGPCIPNHMNYGASQWNVAQDTGQFGVSGRNDYFSKAMDNSPLRFMRLNQGYNRGTNFRQSFHGSDKHIASMQQNLPSLEHTTKSFLRSWRIDSYLNTKDKPMGDSSDHINQCDVVENKAVPYTHSRLRASLVFKSAIPEQPECNSYTNSSASTLQGDESETSANNHSYVSTQRIPTVGIGSRLPREEFSSKQRMTDDRMGSSSGGYSHLIYASLGRTKRNIPSKNHDFYQDERFKRYSLVDPKPGTNSGANQQSLDQLYGASSTDRVGPQKDKMPDVCQPNNLNEERRSVSHYDVKKDSERPSPLATVWQEPPSRTVSATALSVSSQEPAVKSPSATSPHFFKLSSKRIKSLLHIPEKKDGSSQSKGGNKIYGSREATLSEDEVARNGKERKVYSSTTSSIKSTDGNSHLKVNGHLLGNEKDFLSDTGTSSAPRFSTEELHERSPFVSLVQPKTLSTSTENTRPSIEARNSDQRGGSRLYSRFEPFCTFEKKPNEKSTTSVQVHTLERHKSLPTHKSTVTNNHNAIPRHQVHAHGDNKFGRFIQRVGNLINKNK